MHVQMLQMTLKTAEGQLAVKIPHPISRACFAQATFSPASFISQDTPQIPVELNLPVSRPELTSMLSPPQSEPFSARPTFQVMERGNIALLPNSPVHMHATPQPVPHPPLLLDVPEMSSFLVNDKHGEFHISTFDEKQDQAEA
eukprot:TRINITY_DN12514_c0_g1_i1.p1 TRINITY_DN12514_c0_g1~~TRINITY_DN12514_c0_g1_i1.p1  ORF type:complete len:143 (-),score=3.80 TRINITY_DN12514_c0_g1_i1:89-517(-)